MGTKQVGSFSVGWATPSIFQHNRARPKDDTLTLDPESMDRLDYLLHCLKRHGVYLYLDLLTYRQFRMGDGVDAVDALPQAAKPYHYFDRRLIELQKEYNRALWTHLNPLHRARLPGRPVHRPLRDRQRERFLRPAAGPRAVPLAAGGPVPAVGGGGGCTGTGRLGRLPHARLPDGPLLRGGHAGLLPRDDRAPARDRGEGPDQRHQLVDQPRRPRRPARGRFRGFAHLLELPHLGKPAGDRLPAHAGRARHDVQRSLDGAHAGSALRGERVGSRLARSLSLREPAVVRGGGRPHFDTFNDPAKFGLFPAAAILFRRGDVSAAQMSVAIRVPEGTGDWLRRRPGEIPALRLVSERHRVGVVLPGAPCRADQCVGLDDQVVNPAAGAVLSDTGQLYRTWQKRYGWIRTDRTKALYGFLAEAGRVDLDGVTLEAATGWGTIVVTSLSREPIRSADTLLITAVGRCDNTDAGYEQGPGASLRMTSFGHAPVLIEPIEAAVEIASSRPTLSVWVIADNREAVTRLPTEYGDGVLRFRIGSQPPYNPSTIYYLVRV